MKKLIYVAFAGVVASGCSVNPKPLTMDELADKSSSLLENYTADQEAITQSISLHEAMARAIKYNLDYKVGLLEEALRGSESKLASLDMLPDLVARVGLSGRDNYSGSRSSALLGSDAVGGQSLVSSTSAEKDAVTGDLELSWDVLDFGLSYVRAKQLADKVLIANERKRKVANEIIEQVRTAYWRAVSAEKLIEELSSFEGEIGDALTASEESYRQKKTSPLAALTYRRELLDIQREIQSLNNELFVAKRQLAALMNVSPMTPFSLVVPARDSGNTAVNIDPKKMVGLALINRPEIREISYEQRISEHEANAALLQLLPNLRLFGGWNYTSNDFVYNNQWVGWGAQASWNVFNIFRYPAHKRGNEIEQDLLRQRAMAVTMAVVTQVYVSASRYEIARQRYNTMGQYYEVSSNILEQIEAGYDVRKVSFQNFVREKMNSILAEAQYDLAQADLQNAIAKIYGAVGQDTFGNINATDATVKELAEHLHSHWEQLGKELYVDR